MTSLFTDSFERKEQKDFLKKAIDIYGLFSIIQELFEKVDLLNKDGEVNPNKVSFKMAYPADFKENFNENLVIFEFVDRFFTPLKTSSGVITQKRAQVIDRSDNFVTGQEETLLAYQFTNNLRLFVYSPSHEKLLQILQALEAVLLRYKSWFNENYRVKIEYKGITSDASGHNVYHNKMLCKAICLEAYTESQFEMAYEKVGYFEHN